MADIKYLRYLSGSIPKTVDLTSASNVLWAYSIKLTGVTGGGILRANVSTKVLEETTIVNADVDAGAAIAESKLSLDYSTSGLNTAITNHTGDTSNPHSVTKAQVLTGNLIVNADVDAGAAIAFSKLASLNSSYILVGSEGNVATAVSVTGDVTISNAGVTAIGSEKVTNGMLAGSIADSKLNQITTADKVAGSAIQLATSSGLEDSTGLKIKYNSDQFEVATGFFQIKAGGIDNADIHASAAIDATKIHDGSVSNTEYGYLNGVTSGIQAQLNALSTGYNRRKAVISIIADNTQAPPTEVTGDRYILSTDGGEPHANWDGAAAGDIVEFGGSTWSHTTPSEGWVAYIDSSDVDALYIDDGTVTWELREVQSSALAEGKIWIGSAGGIAVAQTLSGDVTVTTGGVTAIGSEKVTNAMLAGSIADTKLASDYVQTSEVDDSSIEWSGTALQVKALGITNAMLAGSITDAKLDSDYVQTSEVDDSSIEWSGTALQVKALGITNAMLAGSITDAKLDSDYVQTSEVDDSSIEWSGTALQVKALGITNAMLAGSIEDSKLSQITTASKVAGSAVQLKANGGLKDDSGLAIDGSHAITYTAKQTFTDIVQKSIRESFVLGESAGISEESHTYAVRLALNGETAGRIYLATNDEESHPIEYWSIGFIQVTGVVTAGTAVEVIMQGEINLLANDSNFAASSEGLPVFLQKTDGSFSTVDPLTGASSGEEYASVVLGNVLVRDETVTNSKLLVMPRQLMGIGLKP